MSRRAWQAWTDEEYGVIADHPDWTNRQIAEELDRPRSAVEQKRRELRKGLTRSADGIWSQDEEDFIRATPHLTAEQVAAALDRTVKAVKHRRSQLSVGAYINKAPNVIGARPLIAKTCPECGLLLAAKWFNREPVGNKAGGWLRSCRKCYSLRYPDRPRGNRTEAGRRLDRARYDKLQALSLEKAERRYQPYVEADHVVLSNPDLTVFEKAVTLQRTFGATQSACCRFGYPSKRGLGEATRDRWIIDNPNEYAA